jgi:septal ring factor EnvC (AmiA/AmiB activator)
VRYDQVNAMLLNEFLKEHKKVEEQQATIRRLKWNDTKQEVTISELKKDMGVLTAQLKEQAADIQKVNAQFAMSRPALRLLTNR